jgi:hypothetical protein
VCRDGIFWYLALSRLFISPEETAQRMSQSAQRGQESAARIDALRHLGSGLAQALFPE